MDKKFIIVLAIVVLGFVGFLAFSKNDDNQTASGDNRPELASQHIYGNKNSTVKLVSYGDFQCPACGVYESVTKVVREKYADQMSYQSRNYPLVEIHMNAMYASRVAEAASKQGKYWEMHELLYDKQGEWSEQSSPVDTIEGYATSTGLNLEQLRTDLASQQVLDTIQADISEGKRAGVTGTPTFILNGQKVENILPSVEAFSKAIDEAIAKENVQ